MEILILKVLCPLSLLFGIIIAQPIFLGTTPLDVFNNDNSAVGTAKVEKLSNDYETSYKGEWELACNNAKVSAMHMILLPNNNKAIMFDSTVSGPSKARLPEGTECRPVPKKNETDCWAHAVEYDIDTAAIRPLEVLTDPWCSSGGLSPNGTLINTGGWSDGKQAVRYLQGCETCDWIEYPTALSGIRWYSTQQMLPDGSFILVGGRKMFNYEFVPAEGSSNPTNFKLPFLSEVNDYQSENNLYPFVHLSTDGNLFIFANYRSILFNPKSNSIIREFPPLEGGARNYPGSGMSALLPLKLFGRNQKLIPAEVLVCGGAKSEAFKLVEKKQIYLPALKDCARLKITEANAKWKKENMPTPRVMGDMLILPNGDILIINGAMNGTSGWSFADNPNLTPVLYRPMKPRAQRFVELNPTTIPRMYHSTSAVLPDGRILVAGSNTNNRYKFDVKYPTELRVEKFSPPYLDPSLAVHRPLILTNFTGRTLKYGQRFELEIKLKELAVDSHDWRVTMYAPPFTTHGFSMNQRLLLLHKTKLTKTFPEVFQIGVLAPPHAAVAPPGYYLLYAVFRGIPSEALWIKIS